MTKSVARTVKVPSEEIEQINLSIWLKYNNIRHTASANGGSRHKLEAAKLKRTGVSPGFPDITIPYPCGNLCGLYIELKRASGGVVSEYQKGWIEFLNSQKYYATVACGFDEAKQIVKDYFNLATDEQKERLCILPLRLS